MIIKLYRDNTSEKDLLRLCALLRDGGVIIYPTDSVYAFGCCVSSSAGVSKLQRLCGKDVGDLSLLFSGIGSISDYCKVDNVAFSLLKRNTPGPVTFILRALSRLPARVLGKRKSIGVRISSNPIASSLVGMLGEPMLTASLKGGVDADVEDEYLTDSGLISERWGSLVDCVIDGGLGSVSPSTVVDLSDGDIVVVRSGAVELR